MSKENSEMSSEEDHTQSDLDLGVIELIFGDAFADIDGDVAGLNAIEELGEARAILREDNEQKDGNSNPEIASGAAKGVQRARNPLNYDTSSEEEKKSFAPPVLYSQQGGQMRVFQFSGIFLPESEKMRERLCKYNQSIINPASEPDNEQTRQRKRQLKLDLKKVNQILCRKAHGAQINVQLEDFYYLKNCSRLGIQGKKLSQQTVAAYKQNNSTLIQKVEPARLSRHKQTAEQIQQENSVPPIILTSRRDQLLEACRVEELIPKFKMPSPTDIKDIKAKLVNPHPAPEYTEPEKQIFAYLKGVSEDQITGNLIQEWQLQKHFEGLKDKQGRPVSRKRYWGEVGDASSSFQLERDHRTLSRHKKLRSTPFKIQAKDTSVIGMVNNFREYKAIRKDHLQRDKVSQTIESEKVTAAGIMRHVRYKMGIITAEELYRAERHESLTADIGAYQQKQHEFRLEENLDVLFERQRQKIQAELHRKKEIKERANMATNKPATSTQAYTPITQQVNPFKKIPEEQPQGGQNGANGQANDMLAAGARDEPGKAATDRSASSSSDDSDDEDSDAINKVHRNSRFRGRVLPTLGDELNHAKCIKDLSFYRLNWTEEELQCFHRPNIQLTFIQMKLGAVQIVPVSLRKDEYEQRLNPHDYFKDRLKLSLLKGRFCIFEHIDQHPLFVNNFGMASRLKRYYYDDRLPSKKVFQQRHENRGTRHMGPNGEIILMGKKERLDLLGQVDTSAYKGLGILENKMSSAPVFYHAPHRCDFVCSMIKNKAGSEFRIALRELDHLYTIGQLEPKIEVYNPQSRYYQNFIKQRSKAYIIRFLQENAVINFSDIVKFFPHIGEPILKKGLKEIEVEIDRNGECKFTENFDFERFQDRMTPEMICQYESARHGQWRLERLGIGEILGADKISYSTNKFCQVETDMTLQRVAKLIESHVISTPWNLSSSYLRIRHEGSMMMLDGPGDPSFGHGGYSFLKMPLKISADSLHGARQNRMNLNPAIQNPKAVKGTEADLRKLQKDDIYQKLLKQGVPEEILQTKTRWQMVALLRHYATNQEENKQYARGVRYTSKKQQEMYYAEVNKTFRQQMDTLAALQPVVSALSEDEPDFTQSETLKSNRKMIVGKNAVDFSDEIKQVEQDDFKQFKVEVWQDDMDATQQIDRIEDIPNYLNLLLVKLRNAPLLTAAVGASNSTSSLNNLNMIGSTPAQITADYLESLTPQGKKELMEKLLEKLQNREISYKCEILCQKMRSLTQMDRYQRMIFCTNLKTVKKFTRSKNKNRSQIRGGASGMNSRFRSRHKSALLKAGPLTAAALGQVAGSSQMQGDQSVASKQINAVASESATTGRIKISSSQLPNKKSKKKQTPKPQMNQPIVRINYNAEAQPPSQASPFAISLPRPTSFPQSENPNSQPTSARIGPSQAIVLNMAADYQPTTICLNLLTRPSIVDEDDEFQLAQDQVEGDGDDIDIQISQAEDDPLDYNQSDYYCQEDVVPKKSKAKTQVAKQSKVKKQTTTSSSRFRSLGFGKDDFDYQQPVSNNRSQRKRQQQCDQALNQIFAEVLQCLWDYDFDQYFHNQVTKADAPNYRQLIKRPIALKDMKNKCNRSEYKSGLDLRDDVRQMRVNAELYNGVQHPISNLAVEMEELLNSQLEKRHDEIINLEGMMDARWF